MLDATQVDAPPSDTIEVAAMHPSEPGLSSLPFSKETTAHGERADASGKRSDASAPLPPITGKLFSLGFKAALLFALVSLLAAIVYMFVYLNAVYRLVAPDTAPQILALGVSMFKMVLLSCGVFVGLAFGFLGFCLFLIGIRDEMSVEGSHEQAVVKFARISPGVFVIVCATVLIGLCCTHNIETDSEFTSRPTSNAPPRDPLEDPLPGQLGAPFPGIEEPSNKNEKTAR
jgi:hypothetical protein